MAARHLDHRTSLIALRIELVETCNRVQAHPLTQAYVPSCSGLLTQWEGVFAQELKLRDGINAAKVRIFWLEVVLNSLASRVSKALLTLLDDKRWHPMYVAYFGNKTLGEFRRLHFAMKLNAIRLWIPQLLKSGVPELVALAEEVATVVADATEAAKTHEELEQEDAYFRRAGERKEYFDHVNSIRKQTHGDLSALPYHHPALPSDFADLFFLHERSKEEEVVTIQSVQVTLAHLAQLVAEQQAMLVELEDAADFEAKEAAKLEAKKALAVQLEKEAEDADNVAKAKRAQIAELNL